MTDFVQKERRKQSWAWAFAKWTAELPSLMHFYWRLTLFLSIVFFVGIGIIARLTSFNLLVSFFLAEAAALFAFYVFWKARKTRKKRE